MDHLIQRTKKGWQLLHLKFQWVLKTPSCLTMFKTRKTIQKVFLQVCTTQFLPLMKMVVVKTCNTAGLRILQIPIVSEILEHPIKDILGDKNDWLLNKLENVEEDEEFLDHEIVLDGEKLSVNVSLLPLLGQKKENLGTMLMIEDISSEKRMKSTMSRYMDPELADQLMNAGDSDDIMGGKQSVGTVSFQMLRSFTTITEELGAQGTVKLLNEYFTIMVDCITDEGGMLDKFIGDAMMCIFGTPVPHDDDPDRAVRAAIRMMTDLKTFNDKRSTEGKWPSTMEWDQYGFYSIR